MQITPPKQMTLLISAALVVVAVVVRFLAYKGTQMPFFPAEECSASAGGHSGLLRGKPF